MPSKENAFSSPKARVVRLIYIFEEPNNSNREKKTKKNVYSSEIRRLLKMEYFEHLVDFLMNLKASGHFWCTEYFNMNLITIWLGNIIIANDTNLEYTFYFYFTTQHNPLPSSSLNCCDGNWNFGFCSLSPRKLVKIRFMHLYSKSKMRRSFIVTWLAEVKRMSQASGLLFYSRITLTHVFDMAFDIA